MNDSTQCGIEPVPVDEIRGKSVEEVVKSLGWEPLKEFNNGEVFYQNHLPNGENIYLFNLHKDTIAEDIIEEVSYKSEKDLYREWVGFRNNGVKGIPERNEEIAADAKVAIQMFQQLSDAMKVVQHLRQQELVTDIEVKFDKCEYDPEADILTTSGKMNFDGKQYDVAFKENGGIPAIEIARGDELEISGQRGGNIEVSFGDAAEGKAIVAALDSIFKEATEKADAYQHTEPDGRLAHLNYESAELDSEDIDVFDVHKNEGDVGDLIGKMRVDDETLRFTADRDGEVRQLALSGESLQDPRDLAISDNLANLVYDAVEDSVTEYVRNEEIDKALGIDSTGPDKDRNCDELEI
jgi:hypothetical protein